MTFYHFEIDSAEEDSEDSQELPVDPQAAVLATSANQVGFFWRQNIEHNIPITTFI